MSPPLAWSTHNAAASGTDRSFTWPATSAGDLAVVVIQAKTAIPTYSLIPAGFTEVPAGPVNNANGTATQSVWVKTCTGSESGTAAWTSSLGGQYSLVAAGFSRGTLDSSNQASNDTGANQTHVTCETVCSGPDRTVVSILGGRFSTTQTTQGHLTPPTGFTEVVEWNVAAAATNNEIAGIAYATQSNAGATVTDNWASDIGIFSVSAVLTVYTLDTTIPQTETGSGRDRLSTTVTLADAGSAATVLGRVQATAGLTLTVPLASARHYRIYVRATDGSGNRSAYSTPIELYTYPKVLPDAGTGSDLLTVAAVPLLGESGTGTDLLGSARTVTEAGTGTDTLTAGASGTANVLVSDAGQGSDLLDLPTHQLGDAGSGTDSSGTGTPIHLAESGSGTDSISNDAGAAKTLPDAGSGTEGMTHTGIPFPATLSVTARIAALESALLEAGESASSGDSETTNGKTLTDSGAGSDDLTHTTNIVASAAVTLPEAGRGGDTLSPGNRTLTLSEAGQGGDRANAGHAVIPDVVWTVSNSNAGSLHPSFTWPVSPAPAYGDLAVVVLQLKSVPPTLTNDGGFTLLRPPVNSPNGNATQAIYVKTCTGAETGTVTWTSDVNAQWTLVAVGLGNAGIDTPAYNQADNGNTALTIHPTCETTSTQPARILTIMGGRSSTNTATGAAPFTVPPGVGLAVQRNAAVSGTTNEAVAVGSYPQEAPGPTLTGTWDTASGWFTVSGVISVAATRTTWTTGMDAAGSSSGTMDARITAVAALTGTGVTAGTLDVTLTQSSSKHLPDSGIAGDTLRVARLLPVTMDATGTSTATLAATLAHGTPLILTGTGTSSAVLDMTLSGGRPWDVPVFRYADDPDHLPDHEVMRACLIWLIGQFDNRVVPTGPKKWG